MRPPCGCRLGPAAAPPHLPPMPLPSSAVSNTLASLPFIFLIAVVSAICVYWLADLRGGAGYVWVRCARRAGQCQRCSLRSLRSNAQAMRKRRGGMCCGQCCTMRQQNSGQLGRHIGRYGMAAHRPSRPTTYVALPLPPRCSSSSSICS